MSLPHPLRIRAVLPLVGTLLTLVVIVLGAYVRLSDAGLGCPDWPGCYGRWVVPNSDADVTEGSPDYSERPLVHAKAWKEMTHRYAAALLGLTILVLALRAWVRSDRTARALPTALLMLVLAQGLLGMWTVTLLLKPLIVMAHLAGGLTVLALLWWLTLRELSAFESSRRFVLPDRTLWRGCAALALVVLGMQIALGGWTSANYAAVACVGFPQCNGEWWPASNYREGFVLWRGLGIDYEGGVLDHPARVAIQLTHRIGAAGCVVVIGTLGVLLARLNELRLRQGGMALLAILGIQIGLGIANVSLHLPLPVAVSHNGVAALLLMAVVSINYALAPPR